MPNREMPSREDFGAEKHLPNYRNELSNPTQDVSLSVRTMSVMEKGKGIFPPSNPQIGNLNSRHLHLSPAKKSFFDSIVIYISPSLTLRTLGEGEKKKIHERGISGFFFPSSFQSERKETRQFND